MSCMAALCHASKIHRKVFSVFKFKKKRKKDVTQGTVRSHSKNKTRDMIGQILTVSFLVHTFYKKAKILLCLLLCSLVGGLIYFGIAGCATVSCVMSLNYEESAKGKTPNGGRFSASDFLSQDYLNAILQKTGLQGEITTSELADMITISPTNAKTVTDEEDYYITSSYRVNLQMPWLLMREIRPSVMLDEICRAYQEKFTNENQVTAKSLEIQKDYTDMDYDEISAYFSMMNKRIRNYLDVRNGQAGAYMSDDGLTYSALRKESLNLESYTLAEFKSYIWENGIAKDRNRRMADLQEMNRQLKWKHANASQKSAIYMEILNMYNNQMASSVLIPTYDENGAFYMSRTKVGIDDLALDANSLLSDATDYNQSMETNTSKIDALSRNDLNRNQTMAEKMVKTISDELSNIVSKVESVDADYYAQKISEYLMFRDTETSRMQRFGVKKAAMAAIAICILYYIGSLPSAYKKEMQDMEQEVLAIEEETS